MRFNKKESPLTDFEREKVIPFLKAKLIERHNAGYRVEITGKKIIEILSLKGNITINESRLRKLIYHISIQGLESNLVLCATSKGYFTTNDSLLITKYKNSLHDRIKSQLLKFEAVERDCARIENRKQLTLTDIFYPKSKVS